MRGLCRWSSICDSAHQALSRSRTTLTLISPLCIRMGKIVGRQPIERYCPTAPRLIRCPLEGFRRDSGNERPLRTYRRQDAVGGRNLLSPAHVGDEKICGVILISTPSRPLGQVLDEQLKANPANSPILDEAERIISELEAGHRVDKASISPVLLPLFHPAVQGFLISQFAIDPAKLAAKCSKPVLILQGERDIQVGRRDAQLLRGAQPKVKLILLPATNHVLKEIASDDRRANIATYSDPGLPLAPGVVSAIADFIKAPPR
jgi:hypothetical protein